MIEINEWLSISEISGSGDKEITISASSHRELEERIKSLKFKADEKQVYVNITQKAFVPIINLSETELIYSQNTLLRTVTINSNVEWSAIPSSDWFHLSQTSGEEGKTVLTITADSISSPSDNRSGVIDFFYNGNLVSSLVINQIFEIIFELSTTSIDMINNLTATIDITSNVEWNVGIDGNWISVIPLSGYSNGSVDVTVREFDGIEKNGYINFYFEERLLGTVRIYQIIGDVETPTDVENCFYIEPYNVGDLIKITTGIDSFFYYENSEWVKPLVDGNYQLETRKRIYIKDFDDNYVNGFRIKGLCNIGGNIETLLGEMKENYALNFFATTDIVDASNLILPSTKVSKNAYRSLFEDCNNLIYPPSLPATSLSDYCYDSIFKNCTSLITAPSLPAMTLSGYCYRNAFEGCTSLLNAPNLPADFLDEYCYEAMFRGCTSLVNAPALPAIYLTNHCYAFMFGECTSLVNSPILHAPKLASYCYQYMFFGCSNLNNITILATDISANFCLYDWVYGVSPTGTFTKKQGVVYSIGETGVPSGHSGIPNENWTVISVP